MAEGRKRFLQVFSDIEQGRRCEELAFALSEIADGENGSGPPEAVERHLRSCATCRAKLRAFRAIPQKVLELMPAGPALDQSAGGRPHEWVTERAGAMFDKAREIGYSVLARGGSEDATPLASAGGTRGAGMAAVAKVLAVCGATAAGGATCVATGVVDPSAVGIGSGDKAAIEKPAAADELAEQAAKVSSDQANPSSQGENSPSAPLTNAQRANRQFSFEAKPPKSSGTGGEFGSVGGGGGSSGSGGTSSSGLGFEH
jgi:hypothetical protein